MTGDQANAIWESLKGIEPQPLHRLTDQGREAVRRERCFSPIEPSAVEQLAALDDPDGPAARRVARWKRWEDDLAALQAYIAVLEARRGPDVAPHDAPTPVRGTPRP